MDHTGAKSHWPLSHFPCNSTVEKTEMLGRSRSMSCKCLSFTQTDPEDTEDTDVPAVPMVTETVTDDSEQDNNNQPCGSDLKQSEYR